MVDLHRLLQESLGSAFVVEREIGGGMAHVFLATETAFDRRVVVKVLISNPAQPLSTARRTMKEHQIRHLPVLDAGRVVGIVSDRDLLLIESFPGVNPTDVHVDEAMIRSAFTCSPDTPVAEVIETMIGQKVGSVVVTEGANVVGVFTTIDGLRALHELLQAP